MNKYSFYVAWSDGDNGYIATCPEFPGLSAFGETADEALSEAKIALEMFVEVYKEEGQPLPKPIARQKYSGQFRLRLPKSLHARLSHQAEIEEVSLNTLAVSYLSEGIARSVAVQSVEPSIIEQDDYEDEGEGHVEVVKRDQRAIDATSGYLMSPETVSTILGTML